MRTLWNREFLSESFLAEVAEWMATGGWVLVNAGTMFGAVRKDALTNWPRVSSKRISNEVIAVQRGQYDFAELERFFTGEQVRLDDDETPAADD